MPTLAQILERKRTLLADGATGTHLDSLAKQDGITLPAVHALLNLDRPELVRRHHRAYLKAGSDLLLTNSWAANKYALDDVQAARTPDEIRELNRAAAQLLNEEINAAGGHVVSAGSVGPTGWIVADPEDSGPLYMHEISYNEAVLAFTDQIRGLLEGGVSVVWIESQISPHEARAAIDAFKIANAATGGAATYVVSMVFNRIEKTQAEYELVQFAEEFGRFDDGLAAFGLNCGYGPEVALEHVARNPEFWQGAAPLLVKANCGSPLRQNGKYGPSGLTARQMGRYARLAADYGVRIVGACCGSLPEHIEAMRAALDAQGPSPPLPPSKIHSEIEREH